MEMDCFLCAHGFGAVRDSQNTLKIVHVTEKGVGGLKSASEKRGDGLHEKFSKVIDLKVHDVCRKNYTRPTSIKMYCTSKTFGSEDSSEPSTSYRTRSTEVQGFDIKTHCLFCAKHIDFQAITKRALKYRNTAHHVETLTVQTRILNIACKRSDDWGREVDTRVRAASDLVAAEAIYHGNCLTQFFKLNNNKKSDNNDYRHDAFLKLCNRLNENDECQYSLGELSDIMDSFLDGKDGYTTKHLKNKLIDYYGSNIIITDLPGRSTIISFRVATHRILHEMWYEDRKSNPEEEQLRVVAAAAEIIRSDIRGFVYNLGEYSALHPDCVDTQTVLSSIPQSLQIFLNTVVKHKGTNEENVELKKAAIGHAIISACRPRSFLSPLLIGLSMYVHNHYGSRLLVDILNRLGFGASYTEVQRYEYSLMVQNTVESSPESYIQFVYDNADVNIRTLDGKNTFHAMGGIKCSTPQNSTKPSNVTRVLSVPTAAEIAAKGSIQISWYKRPATSGLKTKVIKEICLPSHPQNENLSTSLDVLWMVGSWKGLSPRPSWNGYMQAAFQGSNGGLKSSIDPVPFINLDPSNLSSIYTALQFAAEQCRKNGQKSCFVTFDQPLYAKAVEIIASTTDSNSTLDNVKVRLGGFHLLMSFLGAIGYIMSGSGLEEVWMEIYAKSSIPHMITGHAYARALRAHFLTQLALGVILLDMGDKMPEEDLLVLQKFHSDLLTNETKVEDVSASTSLGRLVTALDKRCDTEEIRSRTGKLWVLYFRLVALIRLYIRSERTGDFSLHLSCIKAMLPYFHSSGHLQYAKYAHHYVQEMEDLPQVLSKEEQERFISLGFFTVRRTERFWGGNWTDMVIEQELMRSLKVSGGLIHGRGVTDSNLARFVLARPACSVVANAFEKLCHINSGTTEQHVELRDTRQARDDRDFDKLLCWLKSHSPFSDDINGGLISLSTGTVADEKINPETAKETGLLAMNQMTGQTFGDVKLKRKSKVTPISAVYGTIKVRGHDVIEVNPNQLFLRISCILKCASDYEDYMAFELAPRPPSLFNGAAMRKTAKSALCDVIEMSTPTLQCWPQDCVCVLDGGHLLHHVVWPKPATYEQIISVYVSFIRSHYGSSVTVVFDGYEGPASTKNQEQERRACRIQSRTILLDLNMTASVTQAEFLSNATNKSRLISELKSHLDRAGFSVIQAAADADSLIASTALQQCSEGMKTAVVGTDTDLLALLVHGVKSTDTLFFIKPEASKGSYKVYPVTEISINLGNMKDCILFAHAFSGCDTTSAMFRKGKKVPWKVLEKNSVLQRMSDIFKDPTAEPDKLTSCGEQYFLAIYGDTKCKTLNELRYFMFNKLIARQKITSSFDLSVLPPTSDAARLHSLRVYYQVQKWLGQDLDPCLWGWIDKDGVLVPQSMTLPPAPDKLLNFITCDCKKECARSCDCIRSGLACSAMCAHCQGRDCNNTLHKVDLDEEDVDRN